MVEPTGRPFGWHFEIDHHINPFVPRPPWQWLPPPFSRFLGHQNEQYRPLGNILVIFWSFIGILTSISVIAILGSRIPDFTERGLPLIVGSFGAAAVLNLYAIDSPLAQPRNTIGGQLVGSLTGVSLHKLFMYLPPHIYSHYRWLEGALSCSISTSIMALTGTVHPPAGATALLAATDDDIAQLGWFLVGVVMLGCVLMLVVALLVNNIQRQFPVFWWTNKEVGTFWDEVRQRKGRGAGQDCACESDKCVLGVKTDVETCKVSNPKDSRLIISKEGVIIPGELYLLSEDRAFLERIQQRLC